MAMCHLACAQERCSKWVLHRLFGCWAPWALVGLLGPYELGPNGPPCHKGPAHKGIVGPLGPFGPGP